MAQMGMVGTAVGLFITIIIAVLIYYNIAGSTISPSGEGHGDVWQERVFNMSRNASTATNDQASTFFTIAPIVGIVIVAVVVISYVQRIGG